MPSPGDWDNTVRVCYTASTLCFVYWCENVYSGRHTISEELRAYLRDTKRQMATWLISTRGYFDKSVRGNWPASNPHIRASSGSDGTAVFIREGGEFQRDIVKSPCFNLYMKHLYETVMSRRNDNLKLSPHGTHTPDAPLNGRFSEVYQLFLDHMLRDRKAELSRDLALQSPPVRNLFTKCANKKIVIINFMADAIRDHYRSGKVAEWYKTQDSEAWWARTTAEFSSISSIEVPFPFGNGMHVTGCDNFFDMLDIMKSKIDDHIRTCDFDIAIISAGAYTPFLAVHVESCGKEFFTMGRGLLASFCMGTRNNRKDAPTSQLPYIGEIPNRYRLPWCEGVEGAAYW